MKETMQDDSEIARQAYIEKAQRLVKELAVVGNKVELQIRGNRDNPVTGHGTVSKVEEQGTFEVTLEEGEVVRFNSFGVCMPWNRQLQVRVPNL